MPKREEVVDMMKIVKEGMLVLAMGLESVGRSGRIITGSMQADKGLVMLTQLLYSLAYGVDDFRKKLDGTKYIEMKKRR